MERRLVRLYEEDVLVYKGKVVDQDVLDAILGTDQRVLWAFVRKGEDVMAVPYSEDRVVWLQESDIRRPEDVEV